MKQIQIRKRARVTRRVKSFLVLAFIVSGIGYMGHSDHQYEQEKKYFTIYR